jgi:hypothetical protein
LESSFYAETHGHHFDAILSFTKHAASKRLFLAILSSRLSVVVWACVALEDFLNAPNTGAENSPTVTFTSRAHPDLAENIRNAQAAGHPSVLTHGGDTAAIGRSASYTRCSCVPCRKNPDSMRAAAGVSWRASIATFTCGLAGRRVESGRSGENGVKRVIEAGGNVSGMACLQAG